MNPESFSLSLKAYMDSEIEIRMEEMRRKLVADLKGEKGDPGIDGKDGAPGVDGKDGKDGLDGKDGVDGLNGKDGAPGADGKDGLNGKDGSDGLNGKDGAAGIDGKDGIDGLNGKDGAPGIDGKDGAPGVDGQSGKDGKDGLNGKDGAPGVDGKDGASVADARIKDGSLVLTLTDGTAKSVGRVVGADGQDGVPGKNGKDGRDGRDGMGRDELLAIVDSSVKAATAEFFATISFDGERTLKIGHHEFKWPTILDRGVWKDSKQYERSDSVTWGGSSWIAQTDPRVGDQPDSGSGAWRLAVKRGRDGKS